MQLSDEMLTPAQAARYLRVSRETVYRYIQQGTLAAEKSGREYRIPRRVLEELDQVLSSTPGFRVREYTSAEIAGFLQADQLDAAAMAVAHQFAPVPERASR